MTAQPGWAGDFPIDRNFPPVYTASNTLGLFEQIRLDISIYQLYIESIHLKN